MIRSLFTLAALVLAPAALGGPRMAMPDRVEDALAFATTDREKAIALLLDGAEAAANGPDGPWLMLHAGEQLRLGGRPDEARVWWTRAIEAREPAVSSAASLGLALLTASRAPDANTWALLEGADEAAALSTQNADRYLLLAERAATQGRPDDVKRLARKALAAAEEDPEVAARVEARLEALAAPPQVSAAPAVHTPADTLAEAERALAEGDGERARTLAHSLRDAPLADAAALDGLLKRLDAAPLVPRRIGVLLPTKGRYETVSAHILEAIRLGLEGSGVEVVVANSGEDEATAVAALEDLALRQGVMAVLGPLQRDGATAVLTAANALHLPIVDLARADGLIDGLDWAFQGMPTPGEEAHALVTWLAAERDLTRFAIFAPDNAYGRSASDLFRSEVLLRGGKISAEVYYEPAASNLVSFARELEDADRAAYVAWQTAAGLPVHPHDKSKPTPVAAMGAQAIFVPDSANRVPFAAAALAFEEFPVGEFTTIKDGGNIPLVGLSSWNNPALVAAGNSYVRSSYFVDAWYADGETERAFSERYRVATGRTPQSLEVFAHDMAALIGTAISKKPQDRTAFRDALLRARVDHSVSGATHCDATRRSAAWTFQVLTMNSERIRAVTPAGSAP